MINQQQLLASYLDVDFDVAGISELSHKERAAFKPIYSMNKWWARRSSSVFRALLLGLALPPGANLMDEFYNNNQANPRTRDKLILDPFMGGGTTVVEALRLGYKAIGVDVNPLSWFIVKTETSQVDPGALDEAFQRVERAVAPGIRSMYTTTCPCCLDEAEIIYAFWVKVAACTQEGCGCQVPLFRDYVVGTRRGEAPVRYHALTCPNCGTQFDWELDPVDLVHDRCTPPDVKGEQGRQLWSYSEGGDAALCPGCERSFRPAFRGAVPATKKVPVFALLCPDCGSVFSHRGEVPGDVCCPHCNRRYDPHKGSTDDGTFTCPLGHANTIMDAVAARPAGEPLDFRLYAIEGFCPGCAEKRARDQGPQVSLWDGYDPVSPGQKKEECPRCRSVNHKFFKRPSEEDLSRYAEAVQEWERSKSELPWPREPIHDYEKTNRLVIHNYSSWHQLFNPRQLLALTRILKAILAEGDQIVKEALVSAFLGALEHQNMLNIYHILYAQSAGAFGRHDFHPKVMACEGNPWGSTKGRGPFLLTYRSVVDGKAYLRDPYDAKYPNGKRVNVRTGEAFAGKLAADFAELEASDKNLLLKLQDSRNLQDIPSDSIDHIVTDPPYADSVQYAELSDFFYVWLREALAADYPAVFGEAETPKEDEIVENNYRGKSQADFYQGLEAVFAECRRVLKPTGRLVFTFHHSKKSQWIGLLESLLRAGFALVGVYPVKSEATGSGNLVFHSNSNSVAYDIIHVCKKAAHRPEGEGVSVTWSELRVKIRARVTRHIEGILSGRGYGQRVAHADVRVMLWAECLAVYSQYYGRVLDDDGEAIDVATAFDEATRLVEEILAARRLPEEYA